MSKHANKKARKQAEEKAHYARFGNPELENLIRHGYPEPLEPAANNMPRAGNATQHGKRDRMKHGVRYAAGQSEDGQIIRTGKASRATGVFNGIPSQRSVVGNKPNSPKYLYPIETGRMQRHYADTGRTTGAFDNGPHPEYRITPPAYTRPSSTAM